MPIEAFGGFRLDLPDWSTDQLWGFCQGSEAREVAESEPAAFSVQAEVPVIPALRKG